MKKNRYDEYIELMRVAYPNSTTKFEKKGTQGLGVHIDTKSSFGKLNDFLQNDIIKSLKEQIESGKRSLRDKEQDDLKINKRRV